MADKTNHRWCASVWDSGDTFAEEQPMLSPSPEQAEAFYRAARRFDDLEPQGRWGTNDQPGFETLKAVLKALPVEEARMDGRDVLCIRLWRPLTVCEVFQLGRLNPDDPGELAYPDEELEFRFWWD